VRVNKLRKEYGKVVAVDNITFGLEYGECFALLGVSGAGKTNCFKCLTGETKPTSGEVTINGYDVTTYHGFMKARKQIGYCP
jgi:ABC-type multidrug transport system ATPase subunit